MLQLAVVTRMERQQALTAVREAVGAASGWITDHSLFSNLAATLSFTLPAGRAEKLMQALAAAGLPARLVGPVGDEAGELPGRIALTFVHDDPDLKREVPAFG